MHVPFDRDVLIFLIPLAVLTVIILFVLNNKYYAFIPLLLMIPLLIFFRDPARKISSEALNNLISPVDGTVLSVDKEYEGQFMKEDASHIAIFLSLSDVHMNRSPMSGKVLFKKVQNGGFAPANNIESSGHNYGVLTGIETPFGNILCIQRVGIIARRIVNRVKVGDTLTVGDKIGLMRFGSRMDLYFPESWSINVNKGDKVKACLDILAIPKNKTTSNESIDNKTKHKELDVNDKLEEVASSALKSCINLKAGEKFLVISDEPSRHIGLAFFKAAKAITNESLHLEITQRKSHGSEPSKEVADFMKTMDVIVIPTSRSMSHTKARREACEAGARIATLPGINDDIMLRTLVADYNEIKDVSMKYAKILDKGKQVRVTTPAGTDITFSIEGREGHPDTGIIHNRGEFTNLPAGEAYLAPVEGTANGTVVVDGAIFASGILKDPIVIKVKDGFAEEVSGCEYAKTLEEHFNKIGRNSRNVAELGIGTNKNAKIIGIVLEDEKVLGTVHIAFGDNSSMGGNVSVESHLDGILLKPTLIIDGETIMKDGEFQI